MRFTFCPLFSGSSGNAIFIGAQDTRILIDAGMPGRAIEKALHEIGVLPETLTALAVTHEHSDHTKGVGILSRKYHLPVYANERTFNAMARQIGEIEPRNRRFFEDGEKFGGHGESLVALRDNVREKLLKIFLSRRGFARVFAHHADDGEDGAFLGNGYGAVGDLGARFHRLCKNLRVEFFSAFADHRTDPP